MRSRTLIALIGIVIVIAAAVVALLLYPRRGVRLVGFARESTATVGFAGSFPAASKPKLMNPLGIAVRGDRLYVAESDAGRIRVFRLQGQDEGAVVVPVGAGAPTAYPSDVAALGAKRLVVLDNSGLRVLILNADSNAKSPLIAVVGDGTAENQPKQPTAVAVDGGVIYVADAAHTSIKAYGADGRFARTVVKSAGDPVTLAGGLFALGGRLYMTDSNAGRVVVFDAKTGAIVSQFPDMFALPRGIGSGLAGGLLVVDTFERAVRLSAADGRRIDSIDGAVAGDGALGSPRDVAWVPSSARAYVTDAESGRIKVYNMRSAD